MRLGIIIQARMGSSRLPGKVLMDFEGKTLLEHIIYRLGRSQSNAEIVIATSNCENDNVVSVFCEKHNVKCFRGDEINVLQRYYDCATYYSFNNIVRMTGDNPFPDVEELDRLIEFHIEKNMQFSENFSMLPIGVGMEIFSYKALEKSMKNAFLPKHFEHADEYILDHIDQFKHGTLKVEDEKNRPDIRLTVDTKWDYEKACYIIKNARTNYITTKQAIELGEAFEMERKQ